MNGTKVETITDIYPQKAIIEHALGYSADKKHTDFHCLGYADEEKRKTWLTKSNSLSLCGPLNFDFFNQGKYLIPGINVNIKLQRNGNGAFFKAMMTARVTTSTEKYQIY